MENEFKMLTHLNEDCLHLKLVGDFDRVSAGRVIALLRRYTRKVSTVIIHTGSLIMTSFSPDEFKDAFRSLRKEPIRFIVTGENASLFV